MKRYLLLGAGVMVIALVIMAVIYHQSSNQVTLPQSALLNNSQENSQEELEQAQPEQIQPVNIDEAVSYSLQNDQLNVSFNNGEDWVAVPVEKDQLFVGEYNGNGQELIENSYVLMEDRTGFLYSEGTNWEAQQIVFLYSIDQGETWEKSVVSESFLMMRFRKVDFLNDEFGYAIISGDRTMSQEYSVVFLTHDGGKNWEETTYTEVTRLISDGGFVDESTGFLSFGTINPIEPTLYVTEDGGNTWNQASIHIPEKYYGVFVIAEPPVKEEEQLKVLINQGPNGDYAGGLVKGEFISSDNGKTWNFSEEVPPDEAEHE
ncbi:WD40/YVTN/BNR-like repeat-containing protein [Oceanobacillus polygoni]|uniref:BNR/Asp-box repeat protein n=1 Tax=Oceanobacillus polygoni TaxID=1235259 RepID=A0A9X0YWS3_9BACI|nr:sialidase family protein [Oceanobacillus polygoni]MBP2078770.1 hypothetical protein [Oceanobacillus polygoni]